MGEGVRQPDPLQPPWTPRCAAGPSGRLGHFPRLEVHQKSLVAGSAPSVIEPQQGCRRRIGQTQHGRAAAHDIGLPDTIAGLFRCKAEIRLDLVAPPPALLLVGGDPGSAPHPHIWHFQDRGHRAVVGMEPGTADGTDVQIGFAEHTAALAKAFLAAPLIQAAGRRLEGHTFPLRPLVVEEVVRRELADGQKARTGDELAFLSARNPGPHR